MSTPSINVLVQDQTRMLKTLGRCRIAVLTDYSFFLQFFRPSPSSVPLDISMNRLSITAALFKLFG